MKWLLPAAALIAGPPLHPLRGGLPQCVAPEEASTPPLSPVTPLDAGSFEQAIQEDGLAVVKFFAPWCRTCARLGPIYERVARETLAQCDDGRVRFYEVNFKESKALCASQRVVLLPTVHFYIKDLGRINRFVLTPKAALQKLRGELARFLENGAQIETLQELQRGGRDALVQYADLVTALTALQEAPEALATGEPPRVGTVKYDAVVNERRLRELEQLFNWLDKDSSQSLDAEELATATAALRLDEVSEEDLRKFDRLLERIAAARAGEGGAPSKALDFGAFVSIMVQHELNNFASPEELLPAFKAIDHDGGGSITMDEMMNAVSSLCRAMPANSESLAQVCENLELLSTTFDAFDFDHSGALDYEEFVSMLSGRAAESSADE